MRSNAPTERLAVEAISPGFSSALTPLAPTASFLLFDHWLGLVAAMVAASAATAFLTYRRRRRGAGIGFLLPVTLGYVVVKGVVGVLTQSHVAYFGAGLAISAVVAVVVGATAFTAKPVASDLLPLVTPYRHLSPGHPAYRRVSRHVTGIWAVSELAITAWEARHLAASSASEFVLTRTVVAWPLMAVLVFFLIAYVRFRLDRYEHALSSARHRLVTGQV